MKRLVCAPLLALLTIVGCRQRPPEISLSGPTMGTTYNVKVIGAPAGIDRHSVRVVIDAVLADIDLSMSGYRPDSEVSRFNAARSTAWIPVSADLATVVESAQSVSAASGGALDITIAPLVSLWGFGPTGELLSLPGDNEIKAVQATVGYQRLEVRTSPAALRKQLPALTIDLNAVAPGFAVDKLAAKFDALGLRNFMIDIGGEVLVKGRNARNESWHIAVEKPVEARSDPMAILQIADQSVTTSGEYHHYYVRDGHRYSHTLDPRTGRPVEHNLVSVVLVGPTTLFVDAWATALNVLGADEGMKLATERGIPAMFITQDNDRFATSQSPGFAEHVVQQAGTLSEK